MIILFWIIFSIIVGVIGSNRKIGFGLALLASLILSPVIGLIITLVSESNSSIEHKKNTEALIRQQNEMIHKQNETLKKIQDPNYVSESEQEEILKNKVISDHEEKFKKGEITLHELETINNNLEYNNVDNNTNNLGRIILFSVIAFVVLYTVYLLNE